MTPHPLTLILAGALATAGIAFAASISRGPAIIAALDRQADAARDRAGGQGVEISFLTEEGWLTRHATLSGGDRLSADLRGRVAKAITTVPGIGGVHWVFDGRKNVRAVTVDGDAPLHCQHDVEAILKARTIRFSEASALIDRASENLLNEVAAALKPCVGSIIAITGHTDDNGDEGANRALSRARADAVHWALIGRGIPADGLRAAGKGSKEPLAGLDPGDPANRRIEFTVLEKAQVKPTPVDTPGPG